MKFVKKDQRSERISMKDPFKCTFLFSETSNSTLEGTKQNLNIIVGENRQGGEKKPQYLRHLSQKRVLEPVQF